MQLLLQGAYLHFFPDLRSHVERRLAWALSRCRTPARHATVSLKQTKPARRQPEWSCAIRVKIPGQAALSVEAARPLPSAAIDEAVHRLSDKVLREVARTRGALRRIRTEPAPAQPQWGGRSVERRRQGTPR